MRTWAADPEAVRGKLEGLAEVEAETGYTVYNKMYGRKFSAGDVLDGFEAYVLPPGQGRGKRELERARTVLEGFGREVRQVTEIFEGKESRMFSASILLVWEGDGEVFDKVEGVLKTKPVNKVETDEEDDEEEEDEEEVPKLFSVKMIDFAHASWTPGQGPDENALKGIRSTVRLLEELLAKVNGELAAL
jgi:1D-myo-inositol-tetrakisphosphate 5-kinase/inositol-polyphosphate multikinase